MLSSTDNLREAGVGAFFRPRDVAPHGISHRDLQGLVSDGTVEKLGKGLYRLSAAEPTELDTIAMVAAKIPNATMCLLAALSFHDIGTESPHEIWIAIDRKAHKPTHFPARVRVIRYSGAMLTYGVMRSVAQGVPFRVTSPARTVVDCFRYRNKLGLDVGLEALHDVLRSQSATVDEIMRAAKICRIRTVIRPYLEAIRL